MSNIIPFGNGAQLPAYLQRRSELAHINQDVTTGAGFPVLSIKGKVFTLVKGSEKKILTRPDDPDEVLQSIQLAVVRANTKSRVFYAKAYSEDDSDGAKPTCYSGDGVAPAADAAQPQASKCQLCKHAVWGSKPAQPGQEAKGTACSVNTRLAVVDPDHVEEPWLLRVPAGSRGNFADACKVGDSRGLPYNAMVLKVSFDKEAPAPKLVFKPVGLVSDAAYDKISAAYDSDEIKEIVGLKARAGAAHAEPGVAPAVEADELDAALQARQAVDAAKATTTKPKATRAPAPAPAPATVTEDEIVDVVEKPKATKAEPKPEPKVEAKAAATDGGLDDLIGDLDSLLGATDD